MTMETTTCTPAPISRPASRRIGWTFPKLASLFRQRQTLSALSDHQLRDIGLTRAEADAEAARPIWDVPSHWRS